MGVKGLYPFLKKKVPDAFKKNKLLKYKNKKIVLDASLAMHRFARTQGDWQKGLVFQVRTLLQNDILPVYVLDGKPPDEKRKCLDCRKELQKKMVEKAKNEFDKKKASFKITDEDIKKFKKWCKKFGIPCLKAKGEADPLMSALVRYGHCHAVWTEDADLLTHGCPIILKSWKGDNVVEVNLNIILKELFSNSLDDFQKFCVRIGTDYAPRIQGPATALKKPAPLEDNENHLKAFNLFQKDLKTNVTDKNESKLIKKQASMNLPLLLSNEFPDSSEYWRDAMVIACNKNM